MKDSIVYYVFAFNIYMGFDPVALGEEAHPIRLWDFLAT